MKRRFADFLWPSLFVASLCWGAVMTYKYLRLQRNPLIMNVKPGLESGLFADEKSLTQMERISFLRQFVERYVSFEPESFWQGQTALFFLMDPALRAPRLEEIRRLREKVERNRITQRGRLVSLRETGEGYEVVALIDLYEGDIVSHLRASLSLSLKEAPRSLENPWGLWVSNLHFSSLKAAGEALFAGDLSLRSDRPSILHFPCAVENFEVPKDVPVRAKITTLNVSEIQLLPSGGLRASARLQAFCRDRVFDLQLSPGKEAVDLFHEVPATSGKPRVELGKNRKKHPRGLYEKTVEEELGFVIEE